MNVKSKYKKEVSEKKNKTKKENTRTKNIIIKDSSKINDILPSKILLDEPKNIFQKSKVYKYEIEKNLETSNQNISNNIQHVFVCIYYIILKKFI